MQFMTLFVIYKHAVLTVIISILSISKTDIIQLFSES